MYIFEPVMHDDGKLFGQLGLSGIYFLSKFQDAATRLNIW